MDASKLIELFHGRKQSIAKEYKKAPLSKQHQMYGAMKEIDLFLEVLRYYNGDEPAVPKPKKNVEKFKALMKEQLIKF